MSYLHFNYLTVLGAAVFQWILGALWYSVLFAKPWKAMVVVNPETKNRTMIVGMIASFISSLILSFLLLHILWWAEASGLKRGALVGFVLWAGFVAAPMVASHIYESRPIKLFLINTGYWLVALVLSGALMARWG